LSAVQDRYVRDIGDDVKLAILRALMPGERLGVAWWLYSDEAHNDDGRHINYLRNPGQWRAYDPGLFDGLAAIVADGRRRVLALQDDGLLPGAEFCDEIIPTAGAPATRRGSAECRRGWPVAASCLPTPTTGWRRRAPHSSPGRLR
jgi:hypothetical protein